MPWMSKIRWMTVPQRIAAILWITFLMAGVATGVFFSAIEATSGGFSPIMYPAPFAPTNHAIPIRRNVKRLCALAFNSAGARLSTYI